MYVIYHSILAKDEFFVWVGKACLFGINILLFPPDLDTNKLETNNQN